MPIEFERVEHDPPGGTPRWMLYMFVQSLKATLIGSLSAILLSFPALAVAAFVPGGAITYSVLIISLGISSGAVYKDFTINIDWSQIESGFDTHRQKTNSDDPSNFTRNSILAMIFGGVSLFAIFILLVSALFVSTLGPIVAVPIPYLLLLADEYVNKRYEKSAVSPGIKLTKWLILKFKQMSAQQRNSLGAYEDLATILTTAGVRGRDRRAAV